MSKSASVDETKGAPAPPAFSAAAHEAAVVGNATPSAVVDVDLNGDRDVHSDLVAEEHKELHAISAAPATASSSAQHSALSVQAIKAIMASSSVTEAQAKELFERYGVSGAGLWRPRDVRAFLLDLEEAAGCPRIVPDEAVAEVLKELQLNIDAPGGVTWVEFKSYLIFLQQLPLQALHDIVVRVVSPATIKFAVTVTLLPPQVTKESLLPLFSACGKITHFFVCDPSADDAAPANGAGAASAASAGPSNKQAFIAFDEESAAAQATKLSGSQVEGCAVNVSMYAGQDFPCLLSSRPPGVIASAVAKVYVGAKKMDEKTQFSNSIKQGVDTASAKLKGFVEEHKLKDKLQAASATTSEQLHKADESLGVSRRVSEMNDKYQLSDKAEQLKQHAKQLSDQVAANPAVQRVGSFFSNVASRLQKSLDEFKEETRTAIASESAK